MNKNQSEINLDTKDRVIITSSERETDSEVTPDRQVKYSILAIREILKDIKRIDERMEYLINNFPIYKITGLLNDLKTEKACYQKRINHEIADALTHLEILENE